MEDYPALMPPAAVPALMPQSNQGALWPQLQFAARNMMARGILPFYNDVSQKTRTGALADQDALWDQYVQSVLNPQPPQSRLSAYIDGAPIARHAPASPLATNWIGVRN